MSTAIRVVPPTQPEVLALTQACTDLARETNLDRFELAVKQRLAQGVNDDAEVRQADELLAAVVRGGDAFEAATEPVVSAAHALHRALVAKAKEFICYDTKTKKWGGRWGDLREQLTAAILSYNRAKRELIERQQRELNAAAEKERQRQQAEARAAMRSGNVEAAKQAMQAAEMVVTPMIATAPPALDNSSTRRPWQVEITDPEAVVKAIAAGIIPLSAIKEWDLTFLKKEVTKRGGLPQNWPGLKAWQDERLSVSRR